MINIIDEINGNKDGKILSLFGMNGIGKTTLANEIAAFFDPYYYIKKTQSEIQKEFLITMGDVTIFSEKKENLNTHDFIDLNYYIKDRQGILLPELLLNAMIQKSFSQNLKYSNILYSDTKELDHENEKVKFMKKYKKLEKSLPKILFIEIKNLINLNKIYFFNSTEIHNSGSLGLDKIQSIAIIIELISSIIEIQITDFLHLIKINSYEHIKELVSLKLYKNRIVNEKEHLLELFSNIRILFENKKLLSFLIDFDKYHNKEIEKFNYIEKINQYNQLLCNNFNNAYDLFFKYFPQKFNEIKLNRRYNSSLGVYIYDLMIIKEGYTYSTFNFINNIGSEGERNLVNFLHVIIILNSINKANKNALILSDDSFDSFDNTNISNIYRVVFEILKSKQHIYINFTHNYEHFRSFNKILLNDDTRNKENMYYINNPAKKNIIFTHLPIKNNFYKDYLCKKSDSHVDIKDQIVSLLAAIPYFRTITQLINNAKDDNVKLATKLLHYKDNKSTNLIDLLDKSYFQKFTYKPFTCQKIKDYCNSNPNYYNLLQNIYNFIITSNEININLLEYRIFISIFIRNLIEKTIADILKIDLVTNPKKGDQTGMLIQDLKNYLEKNPNTKIESILFNIQYLNKFIPDYIHNDISYLMSLDIENLKKGIKELNESKMNLYFKNIKYK